jgi:hypothetical protein
LEISRKPPEDVRAGYGWRRRLSCRWNLYVGYRKKSRKYAAWPIKLDRYGLGMRCGQDPCFLGIYARKVLLTGNILEYEYKVVEVSDDPRHIVFQIKRQSLTVNA